MMEEELQRMKEASQSDPSTAIQAPQRPPRHKKWKAARMKGDKYINEDVVGCLKDLNGNPTEDIKNMFANGLKTYRQLINAKEQGGPKWFKPTCHQQPGSTECGYYVMSWMQSIVNSGHTQVCKGESKERKVREAYSYLGNIRMEGADEDAKACNVIVFQKTEQKKRLANFGGVAANGSNR
ncbi:hypothetical protein K1719_001070 [Acacia pycnantha]|nr:hypothetical protein K1719_001070 [Acacia pycnantha]